jgi:hypothetical protein
MVRRNFIREFMEFILRVVFTAFTVCTFSLMMILLS